MFSSCGRWWDRGHSYAIHIVQPCCLLYHMSSGLELYSWSGWLELFTSSTFVDYLLTRCPGLLYAYVLYHIRVLPTPMVFSGSFCFASFTCELYVSTWMDWAVKAQHMSEHIAGCECKWPTAHPITMDNITGTFCNGPTAGCMTPCLVIYSVTIQ